MKYCVHCGNKVSLNDHFCNKCGAKLYPTKHHISNTNALNVLNAKLKAQQVIFTIYSIVMLEIFIPLMLFMFINANGAFRDAVELISSSENFLVAFLGFIIILMYLCAPIGVAQGIVNLIFAIITANIRSNNNPNKIIKWGASVPKLILCIVFNALSLPFVITCFVYTKRSFINKQKGG